MNQAYLKEKLGKTIQIALDDPCITEISRNPDGRLWSFVQKQGWQFLGSCSESEAKQFCHALSQYCGDFLNAQKPYLDTKLPFHGERVNIVVPPLNEGISFSIRKHSPVVLSLQDYVDLGIMDSQQASLLICALTSRKNILVSGSPNSGKTTLANALLKEMKSIVPEGHRVVILEQVPELKCEIQNCLSLKTDDRFDIDRLLWLAMRNSPDRIIVGEVRDRAALGLLKAWNTGCPGGIATIHANSPEAALQRILDLSCEAIPNPPYLLAAESIDYVVQIESDPSHPAGRRVSGMIEVMGFDSANQRIYFNALTEAA